MVFLVAFFLQMLGMPSYLNYEHCKIFNIRMSCRNSLFCITDGLEIGGGLFG
jgi:hypothetical protein